MPRRAAAPAFAVALLMSLSAALAAPAAAKDGSAKDAVDKPLEAKLKRLDGDKVKLSDLRGAPVLLELWASWCLPCHQQSAILGELREQIAEAGVTAYAVNVGEEDDVVQKHLERSPAVFPVLLDRWQAIATKLQAGELPVLVLLDADGVVAGTTSGVAQRDEVLELLGGLSATRTDP